jgi:hypothetical protein
LAPKASHPLSGSRCRTLEYCPRREVPVGGGKG